MLHGGDFSGLGAVNPILDKFPILSLSLSLARSLSIPPPALLHHTSTLGTHLPGVGNRSGSEQLLTLDTILPFPRMLDSRTRFYETHRGEKDDFARLTDRLIKGEFDQIPDDCDTTAWTATYGEVCDCYIIFRTTIIARITTG